MSQAQRGQNRTELRPLPSRAELMSYLETQAPEIGFLVHSQSFAFQSSQSSGLRGTGFSVSLFISKPVRLPFCGLISSLHLPPLAILAQFCICPQWMFQPSFAQVNPFPDWFIVFPAGGWREKV